MVDIVVGNMFSRIIASKALIILVDIIIKMILKEINLNFEGVNRDPVLVNIGVVFHSNFLMVDRVLVMDGKQKLVDFQLYLFVH